MGKPAGYPPHENARSEPLRERQLSKNTPIRVNSLPQQESRGFASDL